MDNNTAFKGAWKKEPSEGCREVYPDMIVFQEKGIYKAELSTPSDRHPVWDVGTYEFVGTDLRLSTANDRVVSYPFRMEGTRLLIKAEEGCLLAFTRIG